MKANISAKLYGAASSTEMTHSNFKEQQQNNSPYNNLPYTYIPYTYFLIVLHYLDLLHVQNVWMHILYTCAESYDGSHYVSLTGVLY